MTERNIEELNIKELMEKQRVIYDQKNSDYGNSFHVTVERFGLISALIRISDKMERMRSLLVYPRQVTDESLRDTISDALNYLLMFGAELICSTYELANESRIPNEADNVTLTHQLMENLKADEFLQGETSDLNHVLEVWEDLCDASMSIFAEQTPEKMDDLLTVTNYLAGQTALCLMGMDD